MTDAQERLIEHAYWGPFVDEPRSSFWMCCWFMFIGLWLGFLAQLFVIAHPSAWKRPSARTR
jgi:hypothetical protein